MTKRPLRGMINDQAPMTNGSHSACHPEGSGSDPRDLGGEARVIPSRDPSVA